MRPLRCRSHAINAIVHVDIWRECVGIEPTRPLIEGTPVLKTERHTSTHPLPELSWQKWVRRSPLPLWPIAICQEPRQFIVFARNPSFLAKTLGVETSS